jgi:hypothetical protein
MNTKSIFGLLPKEESIIKAKAFIDAHPSFTPTEFLRFFIKKYCKKINAKSFAQMLVWMFESIDSEAD